MQIAYDPQADAISVVFSDREVRSCQELAPGLIISLDAEGEPVAVELLGASRRLGRDGLARIAVDLSRL